MVGFLYYNFTAKIDPFHQTVFSSFKYYLQRTQHKNLRCSHCFFSSPPFFLLAVSNFFSFPSLVWFSGSSEGKNLPPFFFLFFSQTVVIFVWYVFKNPAWNCLAFVAYTLIFVNLLTSSNIQRSLFWSFSFSPST